jgi:hypothetical protein
MAITKNGFDARENGKPLPGCEFHPNKLICPKCEREIPDDSLMCRACLGMLPPPRKRGYLIAAAPDMYEALKSSIESSSSPKGGPCKCGACDKARAALAKADGK